MSYSTEGWILDKKVTPDATLNQGDLIQFEKEIDPLKAMGVIITADCDLKQKKHAKVVTLVPVVDVKTLMENYLLPEDCENKRDQIESFAFKSFGIDKALEPAVKHATLAGKLSETSINADQTAIVAAKFTIDQLDCISIKDYKQLMTGISSGIKKTTSLKDQIEKRGDLLILPDLAEFSICNKIAWMRHIWQEPLTSIAIRTSESKLRKGEKIARLNSPYRYRLTQLMAQVFSDIGLPDNNHSIESNIQEIYDNA